MKQQRKRKKNLNVDEMEFDELSLIDERIEWNREREKRQHQEKKGKNFELK